MEPDRRLDPALVAVRGACVGGLALVLGVAGHVSADGLLPGAPVLVLLAAASVVAGLGLLARPAGGARMVALLIGGQTAIHLALTITAGHRGDAPGGAGAGASGAALGTPVLPIVGGRRLGSLQDAYAASDPSATHLRPTLPVGHLLADLSAHAPMMLVHLLAAALVGLWLACGERALVGLLHLLAERVTTGVALLVALLDAPLVVGPAPLRPVAVGAPVVRTVPQAWVRALVRRGPPRRA
ncbi:hypothetical protein K8Z61_16145 [Nocardioides sp. TRM66260-LWL]|uniref:hypothetical protein n=1 Tax=Nocardioides sp. TRM66260-LWL TaxID=2874478 RepID=UPI001CC76719|nr:hypothetical protein [Nocardioides sp. TRM66260-LWL]MBZ5736026.1 hypothetical protein [Nocardioides sp. TRM66260-LWL]